MSCLDWTSSRLGIPVALGASSAGSSRFGQDYYYQYARNELCVRSGADWLNTSNAGVWASGLANFRTYASYDTGFRAASYLVS